MQNGVKFGVKSGLNLTPLTSGVSGLNPKENLLEIPYFLGEGQIQRWGGGALKSFAPQMDFAPPLVTKMSKILVISTNFYQFYPLFPFFFFFFFSSLLFPLFLPFFFNTNFQFVSATDFVLEFTETGLVNWVKVD